MPLGMEVGLDPSDVVLDWDPAPPSQKGGRPPIFGPCLLWPNGCMNQDATWYGGRPQPRSHCARWGHSSPFPKRRHSSSSIFSWMDQDAAWYEGRPRPRPQCYMGTQLPLPKGAQPPIFGLCHLWLNGRPSQILLSTRITTMQVHCLRYQLRLASQTLTTFLGF